ncbi:MAG TPA: polymer-forming cytoskeletal protein [Sneathiellales bacterium]|nr:polymer-forming cytoskeletal protein [Sneathiellales bacterium]
MFSTSKNKSASDKTPENRSLAKNVAPTIVSSDLHVSGNLSTDGDMQIDGIIEGNIRSGTLAVGESAVVCGEIYADKVIIRGKVTGRIRAREVELMSSARVIGDIWHEVLSIDSGAFIEGHCKHIKKQDGQDFPTVEENLTGAVPLRYTKNHQKQDDKVVSESS